MINKCSRVDLFIAPAARGQYVANVSYVYFIKQKENEVAWAGGGGVERDKGQGQGRGVREK